VAQTRRLTPLAAELAVPPAWRSGSRPATTTSALDPPPPSLPGSSLDLLGLAGSWLLEAHPAYPAPAANGLWREDWFFCAARLQGLLPALLATACFPLPAKLSGLMERDAHPHLPAGETMASLAGARRLFCVDLADLGEPDSPVALLYADPARHGELRPLAIQLGQERGSPVLFPGDRAAWALAKAKLNSSELALAETWSALHAVHMPAAMALAFFRNLAPSHPVMLLLRPHAEGLLAEAARQGPLDARPGYARLRARFHFDEACFVGDLTMRGVEDASVLPRYPYRDDAALLYSAVKAYVDGVLHATYANDAEVADDWEVQGAWEDMAAAAAGVRGLPAAKSLRSLAVVLAHIILSHCAGAGALAHQVYDYGASALWAPRAIDPANLTSASAGAAALRRQYPGPAGADDIDLARALPRAGPAAEQARWALGLANKKRARPSLLHGFRNLALAALPGGAECLASFKTALLAVDAKIASRNAKRKVPYTVFQPSAIPWIE
jgi:arachidonate 15-lipoxygenase